MSTASPRRLKPPATLRLWVVWLWLFTTARPGEARPQAVGEAGSPPRPRVVVLTDISNEPDDEESLVRYLVYANQFDTEALIATTSIHLKEGLRPELIRRQLAAYAKVLPNLRVHAPGYPDAAALEKRVASGQPGYGMAAVGDGKTTPGSELLTRVVDRADPRPVWVTVWGGANTLAQALWDVRRTRTPEATAAFVAKLRVYTISDQDDAGRWLRDTFPGLFYIVSPSVVGGEDYHLSTWSGLSGDRFYRNGPGSDFHLVDNPWLSEHVRTGHGPLGELYPAVEYIMEGDTPSFLGLIDNGLGWHESPAWGGWGGRYQLRQSYGETRPIWTDARDTVRARDGSVHTTNQATLWRWRRALQHDFAARMDWCVAKRRADANHNPIAVLNGTHGRAPVYLTARPGDEIPLDARGSHDPDGHRVSLQWWVYPEAGTAQEARRRPLEAELSSAEGERTTLRVPRAEQITRAGTLHVVLEVTDDGTPALTAYRRAVITIEPPRPLAQP